MMNRKEMNAARRALIECHQNSSSPAETVAALVERIGYETAREIVAVVVISKGEWDQRISEAARAWAFDLTGGATYGGLSAQCFYYPSEIHPAHMDQIAAAMMAYQPAEAEAEQEAEAETETQQPAAVEYIEKRYMTACDLRALCIRQNWYTRGTCEEYDRLFDRLRDGNDYAHLTTAKLAEIAQDIADHSRIDPEDFDTIAGIMWELNRASTTYFKMK